MLFKLYFFRNINALENIYMYIVRADALFYTKPFSCQI